MAKIDNPSSSSYESRRQDRQENALDQHTNSNSDSFPDKSECNNFQRSRLSKDIIHDEEKEEYEIRRRSTAHNDIRRSKRIDESTEDDTSESTEEYSSSDNKQRCKQIFWISSFILVLGVIATFVYVYKTGNNVDIPKTDLTVQDILDVFFEDPWAYGPGSEQEQIYWAPSNLRQGLNLKVINALTPDWYSEYDESMLDWENGSPDALTLRSEMASIPDPSCLPVRGAMLVCNNDYGSSGWKGLNEVLISSQGIIQTSVAIMNEYYLGSTSAAERLYTMCHELGHGFGLNHQDENFRNGDLRTCMDYTVRPQNNLRPNQVDYDTLASLYGIVPNATSTTTSSSNSAAGGVFNTNIQRNQQQQQQQRQQRGPRQEQNEKEEKEKEDKKNKENRRQKQLRARELDAAAYYAHRDLHFRSDLSTWRLLKTYDTAPTETTKGDTHSEASLPSRGGEIREKVLDNGDRIIVHLLLAQ